VIFVHSTGSLPAAYVSAALVPIIAVICKKVGCSGFCVL
jgi:hypothetical protein